MKVILTQDVSSLGKSGELKDEATRGLIKQQLAAFATFIARVAAKS